MLAGYGALGMVVGGIIPFLILMAFSVQISKGGKRNRGGQLFAKFMWFVFIIFLVWKLIDGMWGFTTGKEQIINTVEGFVYLGLIVAGIVWIWFMEKWVINLLFKNKLESDKEYAEGKQDRRKLMQDLKDREADMELGN
jgi:bacteriorhodopsin